jgi:thymidine phosphorylase
MIDVGDRIDWGKSPIADKHCIGGLPGNRTSPIVVAIVAACGLTMPKTSSRAITSPAGTADTMETLAPVDLELAAMRRVVEREGGCIVLGGAVRLSPADDILIRVERALDLDSEGQLVASVLSKKAAAGATHLVLDVPFGATAKTRTQQAAELLRDRLLDVAAAFDIKSRALLTDGSQPVGRGIGPALEARDVLAVLRNEPGAPSDLRSRSLSLAGALLDLASVGDGKGGGMAESVLRDGRAWRKFQAICEAQGGMRVPPRAKHTRAVAAMHSGRVAAIDNRLLARAAKLAGAPDAKAAGIELHVRSGEPIHDGQPLFTLHAESAGELAYALDYVASRLSIMLVEQP